MQHSHDEHDAHSPMAFKQKFLTSLLLTVPTVVFSVTVQSWLGVDFSFAGSEYIPAVFGAVLFFYGGVVFLRGAKSELTQRQPGMMTLVAVAISVAFLYSLAVTLRIVDGMDFWWELATLITIMLLGHWIEMASISRAKGALNELAQLLPDTAELVLDTGVQKVAIGTLKVGDSILARPGSRIAADGVVIKGASNINESMITGESKPIKKMIGATVIAGTVNGQGALTVRVVKTGDATMLSGIIRLVEQAQKSKSKTQVLADKAASFLVYVALAAALLTAIVWTMLGVPFAIIMERVVTVLVVACPHALGLAIPLVVAISTTKAARSGIIVRDRLALEAAKDVDVIFFDKTGTLTEGRQGVVDVISESKNTPVLALAASVESESEHMVAKAIVRSARDHGVDGYSVSDFVSLPGRGVQAIVHGRLLYVGSHRLVEELNVHIPATMMAAVRRAGVEGKTVVYVVEGRRVSGVIILADVIRRESHEAVQTLQAMGKRVGLITGDSAGVAEWVARELGIFEYHSDVLPEHKAEVIKGLQIDGSRVAMVGDGVNDAPALVQADVGIAIGAGTDVAVESAGIVLATNDPRAVAKIITLSSATYRKMKQNLFWATGYNVIAIPLAAGVGAVYGITVSPAMAAVLMSISTIIVAINAQLLRKTQL